MDFIKTNKEWILMALLLLVLSFAFYNGYFLDKSKPFSGIGWADQTQYHKTADKLANSQSLGPLDFHYQFNYPILGSLAYKISDKYSFAIVSYILYLFSAFFLFQGARKHFSVFLSFLFIFLVFFYYGVVSRMDAVSKIFFIPWNNQVFFATASFIFYYLSYLDNFEKKPFFFLLLCLISGICIGAREETVLFCFPILLYVAFKQNTEVSFMLFFIGLLFVVIGYSPNLIIKWNYFNDIFANARPTDHGMGYIEKLKNYNNFINLKDNIINLLFNSSLTTYITGNRNSLFEANPWFYLSFIGIFFIRKVNDNLKVFFILIILINIFYLSGENMNIQKLRYHCLRYINTLWIFLSFFSVLSLQEVINFFRNSRSE